MQELVAIAEKIAAKLIERRQTIGVAESSTGGLISAALLAVPGASAYFLGGAVVYTRDARRILMDIPDDAMKGIRSASEAYAKLLASQIRARLRRRRRPQLHRRRGPGAIGDDAGDRQHRSRRQHAGVCGDGTEFSAAEFGAVRVLPPSPRLRGEGRGEGDSPHVLTRGGSPSPEAFGFDLSPQAGEVMNADALRADSIFKQPRPSLRAERSNP